MRTAYRVLAASLVAGLVSSGPSVAADKFRYVVEKTNRDFIAAFNAHDAARIGRLYASDAAVFPPGAERASGRAAIQKFWQGMIDAGITNVSVQTREAQSSGNLGYEVGQFALDAPGKDGQRAHVTGKYVVVWKRIGGTWRLYRDIWNDTPPQP